MLMRITSLFTAIFILTGISSFAQSAHVKGSVTDTVNKKQLVNSSVVLLRKTDSILVSFNRSKENGNFSIPLVDTGKYVLVISFPGFADYSDELQFTGADIDLGSVYLTPRSKLMEEIIVKKTIPAIRFKGDTIVYKADSFRVQPGATVEDLLKKLPGIVVDKNGKITAQGEQVKKVMVDGEEFFSDDPTIATKNLMSNMVDDVEVFDKKTDQAEFTGIDDGQKTKTINLKLKEDKKNGYFGKAEAGTNFGDYWNNSVMANQFKGKRKVSGYGVMSSTNKTGLDWQDNMNYGGTNMESGMNDDGGMYISFNNQDEFDGGGYYGEGLPKSWAAGLHFSNKWDKDNKHLNGNYRFNKLDNNAQVNTRSQYILPDTLYYVNERNNLFNNRQRHKLEGIYDVKLDSLSSIKVNVNGSVGDGYKRQDFNTESLNDVSDTVNTSRRQTTTSSTNQAINTTITYRRKFKRPGNTFSATFRQQYANLESDGFLKANTRFFDESGDVIQNDLIDQEKINQSKNLNLMGRLSYTHPVSKKGYVEINYQLENKAMTSLRQTLEKSNPTDPKYDEEVPAFTNNFDFNTLLNTAGVNYRYSKPKKYSYSFGMNVSANKLVQKDLKRDTTSTFRYLNFFPMANLQLNMKKSTNLYLSYRGSTQQPSINMLQPVADNTDPLNISIGNPDLNIAINHNLEGYIQKFNFIAESGYWANMSLNYTQNSFATRDVVDSTGRRIYQTVNVNGVYNAYGYFSYNFKIKNTGWNFDVGSQLGYYQTMNFVNGEKNRTRSGNIGVNSSIRYMKEKKYSLGLRPEITYNFSTSSIRTDIKTDYWTQNYSVEYGLFFLKKFELNGEVTFQYRQKTSAFPENTNAILWNMWLDRKFAKNDAFKLRIYAFDILNQNIGFRRTINTNMVSERTYNTFNQYVMVSVIWNFSKNGKPMSW